MFGRFMPQEGRFFEAFNELCDQVWAGTCELASLMDSFDNLESRVRAIESIELNGDRITHGCVELLHKTFITPLDREEIHQLITRLDDILDLTEDAAQSVFLYDIHAVTPDAKRLADLCVACTVKVKQAVALLSNMENARQILDICLEIDRLEGEADHVMRTAMAQLFRAEPDVRQVMKLRAIYELLEAITDRCSHVANILEGIVLENA
jgi:predicted phosphate transport protein (TIGR00153 family)